MPLLNVGDTELFYAQSGVGAPAMLLVHGGLCDHHDWDRLVPFLAPRHVVVTPDLRAHGASYGDPADFTVERCAADLNTLIDHLQLGPAMLVGHSFASRIVVETALMRPDNAAGLVLLDGSRAAGGDAKSEDTARAAPLATVLATTLGETLHGPDRTRILDTMAGAPPALMAASVAEIERWDGDRAATAFAGLSPGLRVLAIQSTFHDRTTPRRSLATAAETTPYLDFLRQSVADLDVHVLPGTGHFSMVERTREVAALLLGFATAIGDSRLMRDQAT